MATKHITMTNTYAGMEQIAAVTTAAILGGNVRVGLENSLW